METQYITALETRARWLRWALDHQQDDGGSIGITRDNIESWRNAMPLYAHALQAGDTFFMNAKFASLVDHARRTIPDNLAFDASWMQSTAGFLYIEEPFAVPRLALSSEVAVRMANEKGGMPEEKLEELIGSARAEMKISAIAWAPSVSEVGVEGVEFFCFLALEEGFTPWSYFGLSTGEKLIDRIRAFESRAGLGTYWNGADAGIETGTMEELHEVRWIYAACYLMAQRLTTIVTHQTDRHTRRRGERTGLAVTPLLRLITLRRLEEARKTEGHSTMVDWQWQWEVRGHWRNQYFPSTGEHKPVFVEAYIKGPDNKPLKPPGHKLFIAAR